MTSQHHFNQIPHDVTLEKSITHHIASHHACLDKFETHIMKLELFLAMLINLTLRETLHEGSNFFTNLIPIETFWPCGTSIDFTFRS